ncbi:MAG: L,D-transpeptidase [Mangrovicoccus sp.]|nr:L,D-transpeptidase [Mangrovicoccus sp.]
MTRPQIAFLSRATALRTGALRAAAGLALLALAACATPPPGPDAHLSPAVRQMYGPVQDGEFLIPAVPPQYLNDNTIRQDVAYWSDEDPGTIIVDPWTKHLYFIQPDNRAIRYGIAVGQEGRAFSGNAHIPYQRDWPNWQPTANMIRTMPETYGPVRNGMPGGLENPLGARALYLYRGGRDTKYRIHGTPFPQSVGNATSAGCIRLFQQDILDLAARVEPGTRVVVLREDEAGQGTVPPGTELPAIVADAPLTGPASLPTTPTATAGPGNPS